MKKIGLFALLIATSGFAQISEQWSRKISGKGDYSAKFTCSAKDRFGNFYLGGYTVSIDNNRDYLVAKINSSGDSLWTKIFRGNDNSADEVTAIAVDKFSNVCVTGFANGNGTGNDILTIKLNTNGDTLWTKTYNYSSNEDDNGNSIAVDTAGNVFVTGESDSNPTTTDNFDFITLKYSPSGNQLWVNRYGITGTDKAVKVLTDLAGNSYITGRAFNGLDDNFVTIKYNSSGAQQWLKSYDGGANDRPASMGIDSTFTNIYVTGRSDNGNDDDIVTIKYGTASGTTVWTKVYNNVDDDRPIKINIDLAGNVFVCGQSDADASINRNWNIVLIKYASNSIQQWVKSYTSSISVAYEDTPSDFVIAPSGDIYIAGQSDFDVNSLTQNFNITTLKYNSAGTFQWARTFSGNSISTGGGKAILINNSNLPLVVGSCENLASQKDAYALQYDASGNLNWTFVYQGAGDNSDNAYKLMVDANSNAYIAGYTNAQETDRNMTTAKISPLGDTLWVRNCIGSSTINLDVSHDIGIDANGNSYVTGYTKNSGKGNDATTIKYNSVGDSVWVARYNNLQVNGSDKANALALDPTGNIYVVGYSETSNGTISDDLLILKYNSNGIQQWIAKYNGTGNNEDRAYFVKANVNHVFVAGKTWNGTNFDFVLRVYSLSGSLVSSMLYDGGFGDDLISSMQVDAFENIYLAGTSAGIQSNDIILVKFNLTGTMQWARRFDGNLSWNDECSGMALGGNAIVVVGAKNIDPTGISQSADFITLAYSLNGDTLWTKSYNGSNNLSDFAKAIAIDNYGNCFVTGEVENGSLQNSNLDILTLKYDSTGFLEKTSVYAGNGLGKDSPNDIQVKNNQVFVCGETYQGQTTQKDIILLNYTDFLSASLPITKLNAFLSLDPNPVENTFNFYFTEDLQLQKPEHIELINSTGKIVISQKINQFPKFSIDRKELPSGSYICLIKSNQKLLATKKIILK